MKFMKSKKSHLHAVPAPVAGMPPPPSDLGAAGRALWRGLMEAYQLDDAHGQAVLAVAARALDRAEAARLEVGRRGMTIRDRFKQVRPHPLLQVERAARAQQLAALKQLSLPLIVEED